MFILEYMFMLIFMIKLMLHFYIHEQRHGQRAWTVTLTRKQTWTTGRLATEIETTFSRLENIKSMKQLIKIIISQ